MHKVYPVCDTLTKIHSEKLTESFFAYTNIAYTLRWTYHTHLFLFALKTVFVFTLQDDNIDNDLSIPAKCGPQLMYTSTHYGVCYCKGTNVKKTFARTHLCDTCNLLSFGFILSNFLCQILDFLRETILGELLKQKNNVGSIFMRKHFS